MKKTRLINGEISDVVAHMGHTDMLCIADAGLPIPGDVRRIDLALVRGVPSFKEVIEAVMSELEVEEITIAEEMEENNPELYGYLMKRFEGKRVNRVMHEQLKLMESACRAVVRSGECTSYANVILHSNVVFEEM